MLTLSLIILIFKAKQKGESLKSLNGVIYASFRRVFCKAALLIVLAILPCRMFAQQFSIVGSAFQNSGSSSCYTITKDAAWESSAIWNNTPINLAHAFDLKFNIFLGNYNPNSPDAIGTCGPGADGVCFVLQNTNTGTAQTGGGIGYQYFPGQSLAVEFDTYQNGWDPDSSHIAIEYDGQVEHPVGTLAGPVPMSNSEQYTTDGNWHTTEIVWNPAKDSMTVFFDNIYRTGYNFNAMGGLFNGIFQGLDSNIYWGFTGSTGSYCNNAMVCMDSLFIANPPVPSFQASKSNFCANDCISFTDKSTGAPTSWLWTFAGGMPATSTDQNPAFVCYTAPGNYNVTLVASNDNGSDSVTFINYITAAPGPPTPNIQQSGDTLFFETDPTYAYTQWYKDTVPISGATDTLLVIAESGNYNVKVTNASGCPTATGINVIVGAVTGINNYTSDNSISLSPNPASNQLTIHISPSLTKSRTATVSVINTLGQESLSYSLSFGEGRGEALDISNLPAGIYFLCMKSESCPIVKRFVKE